MVNRIILLLWLILFGAVHAHAVVHVSENRIRDFFNIRYDAAGHANIGYDGPEKSFLAYDVALSRAQTDSNWRLEGNRAHFAPFGRLLAAKTAPRAFWVGVDGEAAAQASGAQLLKPSQAALNAAKAGDWSVMRAESAAWAKGASGDVPVFFGNGKGRIFLNDELPELLKNMDAGKVKSIQIDF